MDLQLSSIRNNSIWANKMKIAQCVSRERKFTSVSGTAIKRVERLEQNNNNNNNSHKAVVYDLV